MHLSEAELDTCLDRGHAALESSRREHLRQCDRCAARLSDMRDEAGRTDELLSLLDHELPRVEASAVIRRAGRTDGRRALALAAGVAGLLVAGAAVAIPGSPLRQWIARGPTPAPVEDPSSTVVAPLDPEAPPGPGVRFVPTGPVEIAFEVPQPSGHVLVIRSLEEELSVYAVDGSAAFSVGPNRVRVANRGAAATYEVRVPSGVPVLRLIIAGRLVLEAVEGRVTLPRGLDASVLERGYRVSFPDPGDAP